MFFGTVISAQYSISGNVIDDQNQAIPYVNIILYKTEESKNPKGTITDDDGNYIFSDLPSAKYTISASTLGFKSGKVNKFLLTSDTTINFTLQEETQLLDEVVIKSKRPVIIQTAEKLIVDLEQTETINTSLQDVMRKVPGVLVTNNGISIAGKSGVRILINGKTTEYMDTETLLRDFPADNIAKVEVIEQPGAEYEASGSGAIINIILKKNTSLGTHGSLMGWVGEDEGFEHGSRFSIASYKNKLNCLLIQTYYS